MHMRASFASGLRARLAEGVAVVSASVIAPGAAFAATGGGGGNMPWSTFLTNLMNNLTGPTAGAVALIALFALGYQLAWGGEMSDFSRRLIVLGMVVSFLVAGASGLSAMGITGAVV